MIEAVIFDFDGTLMNTNKIVMESWQHTYRELTGSEGDREEILKTFGEPLEESMKAAFPQVPSEVSVGVYRDFHRDYFLDMIELFPGVEDMLERVRSLGYKTALATSRLRKTTYQGLDKYDAEKFFDVIVTVEDVDRHKPDPESILVTAGRLGVSPENALMVGDTRFDILCGRNAGSPTVLVGWSEAMSADSEEIPEDEKPDYIIERPADLITLLEKL